MDQIIYIILSAVISGAISSFATVSALNVHISYLREAVKDHGDRLRKLESN